MTTIIRSVITVMALTFCSVAACAQSKCLSPDEVKAMLAQVNSPQNAAFDKKLHDELLKITGKAEKLIYNGIGENLSNDDLRKRAYGERESDRGRRRHPFLGCLEVHA